MFKTSRVLRVVFAVAMIAGLSGCVAYPYDYGYGGGYRHHHHHRYNGW